MTAGRLAGGVAQQIHQLMAQLLGHLEAAKALLPVQHPGQAKLAQVGHNARQVHGLARRLLHFVQPEDEAPAPINLVALVEESLPLLRAAFGSTVEIEPRFELHRATVHAHPASLQQLLLLLGWPLASSPSTGPLQLTVGPAGTPARHLCIQFSIAGHAAGSSDRTGGETESLLAARELAASVGGEVEFPPLSRSGRRTIRLLLPEADSLAPISFPPPAPGTRRVLFVDDEETVLRLAVQALEFSGYHARSCSSARECLDLLSHAPDSFDLIISDQRMPGLSGVEMIGALRADGNRTPVLLVSGSLNAVTERQLRELAPARFIAKPFTLAEMLQAVAELLAEPAAVS